MFLALVCTVLMTSCKIELNPPTIIEPSSNIVKNEYKLKSFDELEVDLTANVKFIQSKNKDCRVVLSCPDNYVELIGFDQHDAGELKIHFLRDNVNIHAEKGEAFQLAPTVENVKIN